MNKLTIAEAIREGWNYLRDSDKDNPRLDAEVLLAHVLKKDRTALYRDLDEQLEPSEIQSYRKFLRERAKGKPLAYIINNREFMSLDFFVDERVLIPRPETEIMVEAILQHSKGKEPLIVDVGTGSGAIAISLANNLAKGKILALDISLEALAIARNNSERHQVGDRIEFVQSDLLEALPQQYLGQVAWIAANLPYVPEVDKDTLQTEVKDFEPHLALFGGKDGLDLYRRLIPQAAEFLSPQGYLICEITPGQGEMLLGMFSEEAWFSGKIICDFAGLERFVLVQRK